MVKIIFSLHLKICRVSNKLVMNVERNLWISECRDKVAEKVTSKPVNGYMRLQKGRNASAPRGEITK